MARKRRNENDRKASRTDSTDDDLFMEGIFDDLKRRNQALLDLKSEHSNALRTLRSHGEFMAREHQQQTAAHNQKLLVAVRERLDAEKVTRHTVANNRRLKDRLVSLQSDNETRKRENQALAQKLAEALSSNRIMREISENRDLFNKQKMHEAYVHKERSMASTIDDLKEQMKANAPKDTLCVICMSEVPLFVFSCGHLCVCNTCNQDNSFSRCPMCRVFSVPIRIYYP